MFSWEARKQRSRRNQKKLQEFWTASIWWAHVDVLHIEVISGDRNFEFCEFLIHSNIRLNIEENSWLIYLLKTRFSFKIQMSNNSGGLDWLPPPITVSDKTNYQVGQGVRKISPTVVIVLSILTISMSTGKRTQLVILTFRHFDINICLRNWENYRGTKSTFQKNLGSYKNCGLHQFAEFARGH